MSKSLAWLAVYIGLNIVGVLAKVADRELGERAAAATALVGGLALGCAWYALYPRDLASRLFGAALLFSLVFLIVLLLPGSKLESGPDTSVNALMVFGLLSGLVLTEKFTTNRLDSLRDAGTEG